MPQQTRDLSLSRLMAESGRSGHEQVTILVGCGGGDGPQTPSPPYQQLQPSLPTLPGNRGDAGPLLVETVAVGGAPRNEVRFLKH